MDAPDSSQSADGLDGSQGAGRAGSNLAGSRQSLTSDLKEQWRIFEEAKFVPFSKWDLQATMAWMDIGLGE